MDFIKHHFTQLIPLSCESIELISICVEKIEVCKDCIVIQEGCRHPYMYLICKGVVRAYNTIDGKEETNTLWMENETFGDFRSYITDNPVGKTFQALEKCVLYRFDKQKFRSLFDKNIELANLGRLLVEDFLNRSDIRLQVLSLTDPNQKYRAFCKLRKGLQHRILLKYVASYLKITPETLSRVRANI